MGYRDDHDALVMRAENAEVGLAEAEELIGELEPFKTRAERAEKELKWLRKEVDSLRGRLGLPPKYAEPSAKTAEPPWIGTRIKIFALTVGVLIFLLIVYLMFNPGGPYSSERGTRSSEFGSPGGGLAGIIPVISITGPRRPTDIAWFGAVVTTESGGLVEVGDPCLVRVDLLSGPGISSLTVSCADRVLHRSTDALGTSMRMSEAEVVEGPSYLEGAYIYRLRYIDSGARTGPRSQIEIDTQRHALRVFSEGLEVWSATMYVSDVSFSRWGDPLSLASANLRRPTVRPLRLLARPRELSGPVPEAIAEAERANVPCELVARPDPFIGGFDCRLILRCGDELIYGAGTTGYTSCRNVNGFPGEADDNGGTAQNGDPIIAYRWDEQRLTVADIGSGGQRWEAVFALSEVDDCLMDGRYIATLVTGNAMQFDGLWAARGQEMSVTWSIEGQEYSSVRGRAVLSCRDGSFVIDESEEDPPTESPARYEGELGPGFLSFGGRRVGDSNGVFAAIRDL